MSVEVKYISVCFKYLENTDAIYLCKAQLQKKSISGRFSSLLPSHVPVDLNRLHDDVKHYSCTPRNYSVNLREELRTTNAIFFPRCLLVQRCGGNCGCGTGGWNSSCVCRAARTALKLHEVSV